MNRREAVCDFSRSVESAWLLCFVGHPADSQQSFYFLNRFLIGLACGGRPFTPEIILDFFEQRCIGFAHGPIPTERAQVANDLTHRLKRVMGESLDEVKMAFLIITIKDYRLAAQYAAVLFKILFAGYSPQAR